MTLVRIDVFVVREPRQRYLQADLIMQTLGLRLAGRQHGNAEVWELSAQFDEHVCGTDSGAVPDQPGSAAVDELPQRGDGRRSAPACDDFRSAGVPP